jgi:hypothetical protein
VIQNLFVVIVSVRIATVRGPPHPFRLWWKIPFIRVEVSYQSRLDPRFSSVSAVCRIVELGLIGDLPAPSLSAAKSRRSIWLPKHRHGAVSDRAHEVPLPATEMSGARKENDPLIEVSELDAKPALMRAAHVGANSAGGNFAPIRMSPPDSTKPDVCATSDESLSSKSVQIQLQPILQANTFARSRHPRLHVKPSNSDFEFERNV